MLRRAALATALAALSAALYAAQPQFWSLEGARDFLAGDSENLSIDSEGRVRLAPTATALHDPEAPYVWSLTRRKDALYVGTGNEGKVFRIEKGQGKVHFDAGELEVHALAFGPDGKLYVGTSPDGKVYAVDDGGRSEVFFDPAERYIWALAFDKEGRLLVATGADGRIHRVAKDGKDEVIFSTPDTHVTALRVDEGGAVYAGSAPGGILYRVDAAGKVFVLHDSPYREVKALDLGPQGDLYAALVDGKDTRESAVPSFPAITPPAGTPTTGAEVTVTESFSVLGAAVQGPSTSSTPRPDAGRSAGGQKGAVVRVAPSAEVDTLWSSTDEMPHSIAATDGGVLVGTGDKGKVYRIHDDRTWVMLADLPAEQVTGLDRQRDGTVALITSNPGKVYELAATPAAQGSFTSTVKDADTVSTWGQIRWEAELPPGTRVQIQTRSGNTGTPDSTWTDWSPAYARPEGEAIRSDRARFVQVKATLVGASGRTPILDNLTLAYLQRNLRPQISTITVHPAGEVFQKPLSVSGEVEVLGLDSGQAADARPRPGATPRPPTPPPTTFSRKLYHKGLQTFSWKAEDPNNDQLSYDVEYRRVNEDRLRPLRRGLSEAVLAWDTTTVPNGRYVIRVTARDDPSNPEAMALDTAKESVPFDVDNTPPAVSGSLLAGNPARVRATARDDSSIIRTLEYAVDGGRWEEVYPTDGLSDAREESYEFKLPADLPAGPHVVVLRATDLLGNLSTARVEVP